MKKIKEINERELRRRREIKKAIRYEKLKRGIKKNKEDYEKQKWNSYLRDINLLNEIQGKPKVFGTEGTKKEYQHTYPAKSQWKWNREKLEKEGKVKPEIEEVKETTVKNNLEKEERQRLLNLIEREETILVYNGFYVDYYKAKLKPFLNGEQEVNLKKKGVKKGIKCTINKWQPDNLEEKINTATGEINIKTLLELSLETGLKLYEVVY